MGSTPNFYSAQPTPIAMTIMSTLSAIGSLSILFTFQPSFRNRIAQRQVQIIAYIAISDLLTSLGSIVGYPANGDFACWWEGIVTNVFSLSSIYWSLDVMIHLYRIVVFGKLKQVGLVDHVLCWGIPLLATMLPLINSTYGAQGGDNWCFVVPLQNRTGSLSSTTMKVVWFYAAFYAHLLLCVAGMTAMAMAIRVKINSQVLIGARTMSTLEKTYRKLKWYPIVVIVCWTPECIDDTLQVELGDYPGNKIVDGIAAPLACCQGLFAAIIFWSTRDNEVSDVRYSIRQSFSSEEFNSDKTREETLCNMDSAGQLHGSHANCPVSDLLGHVQLSECRNTSIHGVACSASSTPSPSNFQVEVRKPLFDRIRRAARRISRVNPSIGTKHAEPNDELVSDNMDRSEAVVDALNSPIN